MVSGSVTSWRISSKRWLSSRFSTLVRVPVKKLSRQTTSWPSPSRRSHRCEPRKPDPPVTRIRRRDISPSYMSDVTFAKRPAVRVSEAGLCLAELFAGGSEPFEGSDDGRNIAADAVAGAPAHRRGRRGGGCARGRLLPDRAAAPAPGRG